MTLTLVGTSPEVGTHAPDFTLQGTGGRVTLSQFRGERPVMLCFFPAAFSSTCTEQLCEMTERWTGFEERGVAVFPISVDSVYSLKEYRSKYAMPVDLLSDFHREVSRAYGVLIDGGGVANRAYFLIDRDGVLRWKHVEENPSLRRSQAELIEALETLE